MKNLKFLMLFAFIFAASISFAQDSNGKTGDATITKTRGADPNIKSDEIVNVKGQDNSNATQPSNKGGASRGGTCYTNFDNYTSWNVNVYVDGNAVGYVGGYGEGGVFVGEGETQMYAVIRWDDGSSISYGPVSDFCGFGDIMTFEIYTDFYNYYKR